MAVKKVLFHIHAMGRGGAERVISVLAGAMVSDGIEVVIVTLWKEKDEYSVPDTVRRIVLDERIKSEGVVAKLKRYTELGRVIREENPDVVLSFCNKANYRTSVAMRGMNIPLIVSVRNNPERDYAPYRLQTRLMETRADGCVFQTEDAKSFFSKRLQDRSAIIWNPIDDRYVTMEPVVYNGTSGERRIVTVGRIARQKNHMLLVKAFEQIAADYPDTRLDIYGDDFQDGSQEELVTYVEEHRLGDRVCLKGLSTQIYRDIADAYVFILSSDYEGLPNALMEAMAMGLPVVSTDCPCGGPKSLIDDGGNGLLTPVGDVNAMARALRKVLDDRALRDRLAASALSIREQASTQAIYRQWIEYIESVVDEAR